MDFEKLLKIIDKGVISIADLRQLTSDELVESVSMAKPDNRYKNHLKYDVKLVNGELHYVYVKR